MREKLASVGFGQSEVIILVSELVQRSVYSLTHFVGADKNNERRAVTSDPQCARLAGVWLDREGLLTPGQWTLDLFSPMDLNTGSAEGMLTSHPDWDNLIAV